MSKKVKLLKKTAKTFLLSGLVLAFLSIIVFYFFTKYQLEKELEEVLISTEARIENSLNEGKKVGSLSPIFEVKEVDVLKNRNWFAYLIDDYTK